MKIQDASTAQTLIIKFNGITHLYFQKDLFQGFQTWLDNGFFYIDVQLTKGRPISLGYNDREKFVKVVKILENI